MCVAVHFPCSFFAHACMRINTVYKLSDPRNPAWTLEPNGLEQRAPGPGLWPPSCSGNTRPDFVLMDDGNVVMVGEGKVRCLFCTMPSKGQAFIQAWNLAAPLEPAPPPPHTHAAMTLSLGRICSCSCVGYIFPHGRQGPNCLLMCAVGFRTGRMGSNTGADMGHGQPAAGRGSRGSTCSTAGMPLH